MFPGAASAWLDAGAVGASAEAPGVTPGEAPPASGAGLPAVGANASASQSLGASPTGGAAGGISGTRTGLADVAPVMPLFGAFHDTTSSTKAP